MGQAKAAVDEYRHSLRLQPNDIVVHFNLAEVLPQLDDFEGADTEYREIVPLGGDISPADLDNPLVHYCRAMSLNRIGDSTGAIKEMRSALELDPENDGFRSEYLRLLRDKRT